MRIDSESLHDLARGAGILGSGGGGDPYYSLLLSEAALMRGNGHDLIPLTEFSENSLIVPCGWIGAPTVSIEKLPSGNEVAAGLRRLEALLGKKIDAVMPIEIGGGNGLAPFIAAAELGVPVADADGMGRAFPESQMAIFNIRRLKACPSVVTASCGTIATIETENNLTHERVARGLSVSLGGIAHMVEYPLSGQEAQDHAIQGSISAAIEAGASVRLARASGTDPFEALTEALKRTTLYPYATLLFEGKIVDLERETRGGFSVGKVLVSSFDAKNSMQIGFQNENLVARRNGEICAMTPDLITVMDHESAEAITTEKLRFGQRVRIIGIAAPRMLREPNALSFLGPRAFGLDIDFQPIETLNEGAIA
ncbi:MAG: DUF917 domain-containing protein [Pseudomonadota bacterium]